jgi:hypothetical protein
MKFDELVLGDNSITAGYLGRSFDLHGKLTPKQYSKLADRSAEAKAESDKLFARYEAVINHFKENILPSLVGPQVCLTLVVHPVPSSLCMFMLSASIEQCCQRDVILSHNATRILS